MGNGFTMPTGKIKFWVDTKDEIRRTTAANPGADIGCYENHSIYEFQWEDYADDDDNYLRLSDRSRGVWVKKMIVLMQDVASINVVVGDLMIKAPGNAATTAENGDWKFEIDTSNNLYLYKRKSGAWAAYEKYNF